MYSHKLAIAVKSNGKVLREDGDTVRLPFGSEYSISVKNLNSVRARVNIQIDGVDISDGSGFIVQPNSTIDIERFLRKGNLNAGNRFKFIERTAGVENHRGGIQVDDGLIRVEFEFEQELAPRVNYYDVYPPKYWQPKSPPPVWYGPYYGTSGGIYADNTQTYGSSGEVKLTAQSTTRSRGGSSAEYSATMDSLQCSADSSQFLNNVQVGDQQPVQVNFAGITAPGSISNQQFTTVSDINGDGVKRAMVIKLLGEVGAKKVVKPVTVSTKPKCTSCGRTNKATSKFCVACGTGLELV